MKKNLLFVIIVLSASVAYADTGASGISDAAGGVATYMPYVRALCYVIAAIIAIVGAVAVYIGMHTQPQQTTKRIMMTIGSCLCFVGLSFALPQFFGVVPLPWEQCNTPPMAQAFSFQTRAVSVRQDYKSPYLSLTMGHG